MSNLNKQNPSSHSTTPSDLENLSDFSEMKRAAAKKLIEKYFFQLTQGCGDTNCKNKYCASGELTEKFDNPNQAAIRAIQLYTEEAELCNEIDIPKSKVQKTVPDIKSEANPNQESSFKPNSSSVAKSINTLASSNENVDVTKPENSKPSPSSHATKTSIMYLDEPSLLEMLETCEKEQNYSLIIRTLGFVFSSPEAIAKSFQKIPQTSIDKILEKVSNDPKNMKKEDIRSLEGDLEKDEDCCDFKEMQEDIDPTSTTIDFPSLKRAMRKLYEKNSEVFGTLNNALESLATTLLVDLRLSKSREHLEETITVFIILFEIFQIGSAVLLETSVPKICSAVNLLPVWAQARMAQIWSAHCKDGLQTTLQLLQQLITLQVISQNYYRNSAVHDNEIIINATKVMKIVFWANILLSKCDSPNLREPEDDRRSPILSFIREDEESSFSYQPDSKSSKTQKYVDPLAEELGLNVLDVRESFIPFEEFHNDPLNDAIELDVDYLRYRTFMHERNENSGTSSSFHKKFSFMLHPFLLTPATKNLALFFDSRIKMYSERRQSLFNNHFIGQQSNPFLKLKVRRDHLIDDALVELEMVAMTNPKDLKKQTVVEFVGEQGVDEGGVSKEFFQLIVEEIFNPDYGMFISNDDNQTVWFNSLSFENEAQFTLIGIVLGLAIYNNIILPVNFPMVVYRKLMGLKGSFQDLQDFNPVLYNSLKSMLEYQESDFEDVFNQTFEIGYQDVFGTTMKHILKENGDKIMVNHFNKQEFVELYTDYLLNTSIEKQFKAFKKGFQMVTDESPLHLLFRPEEIELLVCGSKNFDFDELEQSTEYEGGYTAETEIIKHFWSIVHGLSLESKQKLLQFTTGSDRVPVGGLSKLKLVIARHGPDCDRLPTSHTCFNILLLPEYSSKEKLEERLLKAINYSKGFGML